MVLCCLSWPWARVGHSADRTNVQPLPSRRPLRRQVTTRRQTWRAKWCKVSARVANSHDSLSGRCWPYRVILAKITPDNFYPKFGSTLTYWLHGELPPRTFIVSQKHQRTVRPISTDIRRPSYRFSQVFVPQRHQSSTSRAENLTEVGVSRQACGSILFSILCPAKYLAISL